MNLLRDPVLTISDGNLVSLPELMAAMARGEVHGFPALRPHQRPAWHMFLVQLGALALWWTGFRDSLPTDAETWLRCLRDLTPDHPDDEPWRLVVEDESKPAFLQPPVPMGSADKTLKWSAVETPDALDMLITSRNHDLKQNMARRAAPEDWVFALISLQTCEGYGGGRGTLHGIARMNGGHANRPMVGLSPACPGSLSVDPSAWWTRDIRRLLGARRAGQTDTTGTEGGPALLWCLDWPEGEQLDLRHLDPWFIEICRRIRLRMDAEGAFSARRSTSKRARINAKLFKGMVGDPWAPVHLAGDKGKSFTLSRRGYNYKTLYDLLFSGNYESPLLARLGNDENTNLLLIAENISRGQNRTDGFHSRTVPLPRNLRLFASPDATTLSKAQIDEIKHFDQALRNALALVAAGGDPEALIAAGGDEKKKYYARTNAARARFDQAADRRFFPSLWRRVEAADRGDLEAQVATGMDFLSELRDAAEHELEAALPAIPCKAIHRPRAEARARRAFHGAIRGKYPKLFEKEATDGTG